MRQRAVWGVVSAAAVAFGTFAADPPASKERMVTQQLRQLEAAGMHAATPTSLLAKDDRKNLLKSAHDFAEKVAGKNDKKYLQVFDTAYRAAVAAELGLSEQEVVALNKPRAAGHKGMAPSATDAPTYRGGSNRQGAEPPGGGAGGMDMTAAASVADNPTYAANARRLHAAAAADGSLNPAVVGPGPRIVGGLDEVENLFPDCVCVGGAGGYCFAGTLIRRNAVLTAGHCFPCVRVGTKVFVGLDITQPGEVYTATKVTRHPQYGQGGKHNDLCVIVLDKDVPNVTPREIATADEIAAAAFVRGVGYGTTDFGGTVGFGRRRYVDLPIASHLCDGAMEPANYGCDEGLELVAGIVGLDKDTCRGDSGGPIYVKVKDQWKLAGATSRATESAPRVCGDGGIYVRADKYADWINEVAGPKK